MSYVSLSYYMMIILSVIVFYILPKKFRWVCLLLTSCYFYYAAMTDIWQAIILVISIFVSYSFALIMHKQKAKNIKPVYIRITLTAGILLSILPLLASRCRDLIFHSILHRSLSNWILPIGLSFYSMQIAAYLADNYKGKIAPQRNFFKYALFVSFFPLIIQGPISRYDQLGEQLFEAHTFDDKRFMSGIQSIIWGFFLKYMIADKAAVFVNAVFDNYQYFSGLYIFIAASLYSIQLYADFLSCVTISQGVAELYGIRVIDNFYHPYFSTSIRDFWRRWHISFSEWLRDYIYIPLGGNRKGKVRKYINIIVTFAVSGIWHGGSLGFLFWGLMHAGYQIIGELSAKPKNAVLKYLSLHEGSKIRKFVETLFTSFCVMLAWIIFRAESLKAGIKMIVSMFETFNPWILFNDSLFRLGLSQKEFTVLLFAVIILIIVSVLQEKRKQIREWFAGQNFMIRWIIYLCAIWSIWIFGTYGYGFNAADFIYGGF